MKILSRKQFALIWGVYLLTFFFISYNVHAGFHSTTAHSRANCGSINESITWNKDHWYTWRVISTHQDKHGNSHHMDTGKQYTWRCAAVHWVESVPGNRDWWVQGLHFWFNDQGKQIYDTTTVAIDCGLADGWWP